MEFTVNLPTVGIDDETDLKNNTYQVHVSTAIRILQNESVLQHFFLSGVCTMSDNWFPFIVTPSNMKLIALQNNVVITPGLGDTVLALSYGEMSTFQKFIVYVMQQRQEECLLLQ